MDATAIRALVARDLAKNPGYSNPHGVQGDISSIAATKQVFEDGRSRGAKIELWLVLRERPDTHGGYIIVCDESRSAFGLAVDGKENPAFIGLYGSFTETLAGM